jgi:hypothetical protein
MRCSTFASWLLDFSFLANPASPVEPLALGFRIIDAVRCGLRTPAKGNRITELLLW